MNMSRVVLIALLPGFLCLSVLGAQNKDLLKEFTEIDVPTEEQKKQVEELERRIFEQHSLVESYYPFLKEKFDLQKYGNRIVIPLQSNIESFYGKRHKDIYTEQALIVWEGVVIKDIVFEQRRARYGSTQRIRKTWYTEQDTDVEDVKDKDGKVVSQVPVPKGLGVNLLVSERLPSGTFQYFNFRFYTGADLRNDNKDIPLPQDAVDFPVTVVRVRNANRRIEMLREYRDLMLLLKRRVDWLIRKGSNSNEQKLEKILSRPR